MKLLDRLLLRNYLKAYLICLVSLLTLYVVVDLFTNLDDFSEHHKTLADVLKHIGTYYGFKVAQIFDRLCEAIVLMGATFTMAWVQRSNELLPLLSAGVSTRRVVRPVLFGACATLGLSVANQEFIIPRIGFYLSQSRNDPWGKLEVPVHGTFEPNRIHIDGHTGLRDGMVVHTFYVVIPSEIGGYPVNLTARQARYIPRDGDKRRTGGWLLTDTKPPTLDNWNNPVLEMIDPGKYFLKTEVVDFDVITRSLTWFNFASTLRLSRELDRPDTSRLAAMAVLFHMRLTRPILGMLLVVMGLSVILRDQNRNVFISAGMCLCVCAMFFAAQFACKQLGDNDIVAPALAAWLPVLVFGPMSFAMFDAIHT
jgi:lipopolysaccharide export system permease protein